MLIKLRQSEIEEALKMYVTAQGISLTGKDVKIDFTASRGGDGLTADLDITNFVQASKVSGEAMPRDLTPVRQTEEPAAEEAASAAAEEPGAEPAEPEEEPAPVNPANSLFS